MNELLYNFWTESQNYKYTASVMHQKTFFFKSNGKIREATSHKHMQLYRTT